jgi:hypothetical protein
MAISRWIMVSLSSTRETVTIVYFKKCARFELNRPARYCLFKTVGYYCTAANAGDGSRLLTKYQRIH